jgi:hypothetical protein
MTRRLARALCPLVSIVLSADLSGGATRPSRPSPPMAPSVTGSAFSVEPSHPDLAPREHGSRDSAMFAVVARTNPFRELLHCKPRFRAASSTSARNGP